jgi:hypothetical protein
MIMMTVMRTMMMNIFLINLSFKMPLNPYMKAQKNCSLHCNVVGQLEGIKRFVKHMYDTDPKVRNIILQFYAIFNFYFILFSVSIDV